MIEKDGEVEAVTAVIVIAIGIEVILYFNLVNKFYHFKLTFYFSILGHNGNSHSRRDYH